MDKAMHSEFMNDKKKLVSIEAKLHDIGFSVDLAAIDEILEIADELKYSEFANVIGHSPGPWEATHGYRTPKDQYGYWTVTASDGSQVFMKVGPKAESDAKLIAAAPDLLKENQSLRSELQKLKGLERVNSNLSFQLVIQNELNGQLIKHLEIMATRLANMIDEKEGCPIEDDEVSEAFALIKKSKES